MGFLFLSHAIWSQDQKDFTYYNQITYDQYLKKDWNQLIVTGKEALKKDFDFYYLRARMGIAFFEKGIFTAAVKHFEKALSYNSSDTAIMEYLYYAYIYTSRYLDAIRLYQKNKYLLSDVISDYRPRFFDGTTLEIGYKISDHSTTLGTETGDIRYTIAGLYNNIGGRIYLYHYAGILNHSLIEQYFEQNRYSLYKYRINQFDYYANAQIILGKGWQINPVFHFIAIDAISSKYSDLYYGIGLNKRLERFSIGFHYSKADINKVKINQFVPKFLYYPLGNNKLYISGTAIFISGDLNYKVITGSLGVRVFPGTWLEGFMASGRSLYVSFLDGAIIYNNPDYLLSRIGGSLIQHLTPKFSLNFYYIAENKEQVISGDPYAHHVIVLSLHFKF